VKEDGEVTEATTVFLGGMIWWVVAAAAAAAAAAADVETTMNRWTATTLP
jgi:hypothetical protein